MRRIESFAVTQAGEDVAPPGNAFQNYDLKAEAREARAESVRFAFEFPRLLDAFRRADAKANAAKRASRRMGYLSVALVLAALLIASSGPVQHELHASRETTLALGYLSAAMGLIGAVLAFAGMHGSSPRRTWLLNRVQTETMRLFHFHYMAARFPDLARVGGDAARKAAYLARRDEAFAGLLAGPLADPKAELAKIAARAPSYDFRNVGEASLTGDEDQSVAASAFAAWRVLRLDWQLGYVEAMLSPKPTGRRMSSRQTERAFSAFGWICVALILALHVAQIGGGPLSLPLAWMEVAVVWTALAALAARALEDGLQPQRDVERYEQYRANIVVAIGRFEAADGLAARLEVMRAFERTSLEEMRIFMRTHARSRFML